MSVLPPQRAKNTRRGPPLPVHGFVLAGGRSRRMGEDKALKNFLRMPMIQIAVEKLRGFCTEVSIAGNRDDLGGYAAVVHETRLNVGPAAGIEAGLMAATESWVLFIPVDVPLVPMRLLRDWVGEVVGAEEGGRGSYLVSDGAAQSAFCLLRRECLAGWSGLMDLGERRLMTLLDGAGGSGGRGAAGVGAERFAPDAETARSWFWNVNTPEDMAEAETGLAEIERKASSNVHPRGNRYE
jgi:molybdopterin-guanine dinucleotide biosynthesis protein A